MDPPSPQLVQRLVGAGLCRPRDLHRCRSRVRRLARDIPTFETVWLDALVQTRKLTAFQADVLGSDDPDRLVVGPFVLMNRASDDGQFVHYQARRRDSAAPYLLSRHHAELDSPVAAEERLRRFLNRTAALAHPGLASLSGSETVGGQLWVASPWTTGPTLQQLLVRRGRFSPRCAAAAALQISEALAALESVDSIHGDLRLRNVVLTGRGQVVLLVPGLRIALFPERTIHAAVPPDDCDGVAPELMEVGQSATRASEMYALGCLLWELLAGRPAFPHGDPLAKLAAHQSQRIPDVREWAPDTPAPLAELLLRLTSRSVAERPDSFREVCTELQKLRRATQRQLARAMEGSDAALPSDPDEREAAPGGPKALAAGILLLIAGGVVLMMPGARSELLSITRHAPANGVATADPWAEAAPARKIDAGLQPLPAPDADGVIQLSGPGPYGARDIAVEQRLRIRGSAREPAIILTDEQPLRVRAKTFILENVELRRGGADAAAITDEVSPLMQIQAAEFAMQRCRLHNDGVHGRPAVTWTLPGAGSSGSAGIVTRSIVTHSVFTGGGPALLVQGFPLSTTFDNVLHVGSGALLQIAPAGTSADSVDVVARRVTLRGASPMLDVRQISGDRFPKLLTLSLENSVAEVDHSALVQFTGLAAPDDWPERLQITGEGSLVRPVAELFALQIAPNQRRALPSDGVRIEGLQAAEFTFAGPASGIPADSAISGFVGYGRSGSSPGIDSKGLPAAADASYNSDTRP